MSPEQRTEILPYTLENSWYTVDELRRLKRDMMEREGGEVGYGSDFIAFLMSIEDEGSETSAQG